MTKKHATLATLGMLLIATCAIGLSSPSYAITEPSAVAPDARGLPSKLVGFRQFHEQLSLAQAKLLPASSATALGSVTAFANSRHGLSTSVLQTQANQGEILRLIGSWKGSGKFGASDSNVEMKWEPVLGGRFVRLSYRSTWKTSQDKTQTIEGHAYYQSLNSVDYRGNWFDSYGKARPIEAKFENGALSATWGTPATELGKTVYKLVTPDQVEIVDTVQLKDGSWREFHRALLKRQP